eukprot:CAMPEP_0180666092 /NCGR_PEP_ID=MMETSP1037_2-20121125/61630_1 /TAXON_ID=632150 /ORGANISM="Azadinium spinosum, Strain 3D9" /LENGTH=97 /DNA_ID=CAMNT_0022694577 /DNA_START=342 /DNA_END=636 /DNA_ORIENTATION=+
MDCLGAVNKIYEMRGGKAKALGTQPLQHPPVEPEVTAAKGAVNNGVLRGSALLQLSRHRRKNTVRLSFGPHWQDLRQVKGLGTFIIGSSELFPGTEI